MVIQSVNWDRYKSVANLSKCDSGIKLYLDTTLSPIIHALHTQDNKIYFHEGMEVHLLLMNLARISPSIFLKIAVLERNLSGAGAACLPPYGRSTEMLSVPCSSNSER